MTYKAIGLYSRSFRIIVLLIFLPWTPFSGVASAFTLTPEGKRALEAFSESERGKTQGSRPTNAKNILLRSVKQQAIEYRLSSLDDMDKKTAQKAIKLFDLTSQFEKKFVLVEKKEEIRKLSRKELEQALDGLILSKDVLGKVVIFDELKSNALFSERILVKCFLDVKKNISTDIQISHISSTLKTFYDNDVSRFMIHKSREVLSRQSAKNQFFAEVQAKQRVDDIAVAVVVGTQNTPRSSGRGSTAKDFGNL